jgi:hypothetical protein
LVLPRARERKLASNLLRKHVAKKVVPLANRRNLVVGDAMKILTGWRRMDNRRGFMNETTGQILVVTKKQFGQHYVVMLFSSMDSDEEGRKLSPEFSTETKAEACAEDWMAKHPNGLSQL